MRLRIWSMVAATCAIAWWLHRGHDEATTNVGPHATRTSELAELIRRLPTPKQLRLHPRFVLEGGLRLEGHTVDTDKHPIGGVTVMLDGTRTAVSETDGSFAFDHLAAADYTVTAVMDSWYGEDTPTLTATSDPVELELVSGPIIAVHVVSTQQVAVLDAEVHIGTRHAITDGDGNAVLRGLDLGNERMSIAADGFGPITVPIDTGDDRKAKLAKTVVLQPGSELAGIVVDEQGQPVTNAGVQLAQAKWRDATQTDEHGQFSFASIGSGKVALSASNAAYVAEDDLIVDHDGARADRTVTIHVDLGARATGIVVDENGAPVAKASVMVGSSSTESDDQGHFEITGIPVGKLDVNATTARGAAIKREVVVAKGAKLDLRIVVLDGSIAGTVRDPSGAPVEGAVLIAKGKTDASSITHSDSAGHFDFGGLPPGQYEVAVQRDGDRAAWPPGISVQPTKRDLALVLPALGGIAGHVVLAGAPVTYFGIGATIEADAERGADSDPVREADGAFAIQHLAPGTYSVVVVGPTFARKIVGGIVVRDGEVSDAGAIEVDRGRVVTGHVRDARGQPIANALVITAQSSLNLDDVTLTAQRGGSRNARTAVDGSFELAGVVGDDLWIEASLDRQVVREKLAPSDRDIELVLGETGDVAGRVVNAEHHPWTRMMLSSVADTMNFYTTEVDEGAFHFDHIPAGDYVLDTGSGPLLAPIPIHVDPGATVSTTVVVPAEPITLVVTDAGCETITLRSAADAYIGIEPCENGVATFPDVVDGDYLACRQEDVCGDLTVRASPVQQEVPLQIRDPQTPPPSPGPEPSDPPEAGDEEGGSAAP